MRTKFIIVNIVIGLTLVLSLAPCARAVEGALGRPISGAQIMPYAGVVPPDPGFAASVSEIYYQGSIGGNVTAPIGADLAVNVHMKASFTILSLLYVWNTSTNINWNFASGLSLPIAWVDADAHVTAGPLAGQASDSAFGLYDLAFVPITAGYHFSPTAHLALNLTVWAPTGYYNKNNLANLSMNTWTFIPGVAYTQILPKQNIELSAMWAMTFDTKNYATDYQNGILSDLELLGVKRFQGGAGIGLLGSWIQQLSDDSGSMADALGGFRGQAFGIGPILTYSKSIGEHTLDLNARWVHEFENRNYVQGNAFLLNGTITF